MWFDCIYKEPACHVSSEKHERWSFSGVMVQSRSELKGQLKIQGTEGGSIHAE